MPQLSTDLSLLSVPPAYLARIPMRFAREHTVIAIGREEAHGVTRYILACADPHKHWVVDRIAYKLDAEVEAVFAEPDAILKLIGTAYHADAKEVTELAGEWVVDANGGGEIRLSEDVLELDDKAPAVKLVHAMLLQAVKQRASDIHIEPAEALVRVRFRIDGVLYERATLRAETLDSLASRIKVMGRMDIAERRLPQDGGVTIRIGQRRVDLRIATLPSQFGERIVMRLLDKETGLLSIEALGVAGSDLPHFKQLMSLSHGIVLVTGPTGSGKTTTLYAMLSAMDSSQLNILTLEDPIEYQLPGISQTQIANRKGLTFARGLRALVRQDPDIIMVGEIRDLETASVAIQSALTGHLVLSTLHTNDAPSSITRLLDLGVEPYLAASSVYACISQRLVRRICKKCHETVPLDQKTLQAAGWSEEEIAHLASSCEGRIASARGCPACLETGFTGRTGIYEMLFANEPIRDLVNARATAGQIKRVAMEAGMRTLRQDGLRVVGQGITTLEEVQAVTQLDLQRS